MAAACTPEARVVAGEGLGGIVSIPAQIIAMVRGCAFNPAESERMVAAIQEATRPAYTPASLVKAFHAHRASYGVDPVNWVIDAADWRSLRAEFMKLNPETPESPDGLVIYGVRMILV